MTEVVSRARPPMVDDGRLRSVAALLREFLPQPGRLANTMRLVVLVLLSVTISEVFRIPDPAISAYVILFVSRGERTSTIKTALVAGFAVILAVLATIAVFMISLSEPALRVPLIALVTFSAMAVSRASKLGPAAFAAGFIIAYGLTIGDQVLGVALQSSQIGNTTSPGLPDLFYVPPEEALLQSLLWLMVVVAMPVGLVVGGNLLTGRQPMSLLRGALAARIEVCARFCAGVQEARPALATSVRAGRGAMEHLLELAGNHPGWPDYSSLIRETEQIAVALLTWDSVQVPADEGAPLQPLAIPLLAAADSVRKARSELIVIPGLSRTGAERQPLAQEIARAATAIAATLSPRAIQAVVPAPADAALLSLERLSSPDTLHFAFKVALAVMLSYAAERLLDWPDIHTCVVTCFFVSLGTLGESLHKAALRLAGALIGAALGIGTILVLMPLMTDLGDLLMAVAAVTLLAGWVACGSDRISYAGWQIGIAYYLTVLQGYGPTLDMQTARDRVIGILLGNIIVMVVLVTVWPVRLAQPVRRQVATAIGKISALMRLHRPLPPGESGSQPALQAGFIAATAAARTLLTDASYEFGAPDRTGGRPIDSNLIADLEGVMMVANVIHRLNIDPTWMGLAEPTRREALAYEDALATWFDSCATWVLTGDDGATLQRTVPMLPTLGNEVGLAARTAWYLTLDTRLRAAIGPVMREADLSPVGGPANG